MWCRPAATAPIQPLAWEPPYAALKRQKTKKKTPQKTKNLVQRPSASPPSVMAVDPPLVPQTKLLTQYVLSLAKYDQNYDIRDRARFTRQLIVPSEQGGALSRHAKKLFLAPKPAPVLESSFKGGS